MAQAAHRQGTKGLRQGKEDEPLRRENKLAQRAKRGRGRHGHFFFLPSANTREVVWHWAAVSRAAFDLVPQFLGFLETHEVTVLHLVREASVLRLASNEQSSGLMHSSDANDVASHETAPWQWDNSTAENIRALERLDDAWANVLRLNPKIRYHYVAYEQLISPQRDVYFTELAHITGAPRPSFADVPGELIPLHEPTCEERVAQYSELEHQILGTRTHRACLMLAARPLRVLPDEFGQASPFWGVGPGCGGRPCRW